MKMILTAVATTLVLLLSACNTVKGVGQDIQRGGQVLENAAKK